MVNNCFEFLVKTTISSNKIGFLRLVIGELSLIDIVEH